MVAGLVACGGGSSSAPASSTAGSAASPASSGATTTAGPASTNVPAAKPDSDKVTWKLDAPAKNCHQATKGSDLAAAATTVASGCVDKTKMHLVGSATLGEGQASTGTMVKSIPLAAKANHCYRVFGIAESTVSDFDIAVMDSAGKLAGEDTTDASDAIVLENGSICFNADDSASVNTAVAAGKGKWAVEIWSD